jgi:phosphohistidine phosphatase
MRHAKAEPYGPNDRDRPLARTGRRDAATVGEWLRHQEVVIDHVLVSAARRTLETSTELCEAGGLTVEPAVRADLYAAEAEDLLAAITAVPPDVTSLLLVGHNPGVQVLATRLAGEGDRRALTALVGGFPTAAVAVYDVAGSWAELGEGEARLVDFYVGRG